MIKVRKIFIQLLLSLFLLVPFSVVTAKDESPLQVNHVASSIEKVGEKFSLLLKLNKKSKIEYYNFLTQKRLAELKYIVEKGDFNRIEETASRYSTYVLSFSELLEKNADSETKQKYLGPLEENKKVLESLTAKFEFDSGWWLAMSHTINSTQLAIDKI